MRYADCHTDRKHHAKGFCHSCYERESNKRKPVPSRVRSSAYRGKNRGKALRASKEQQFAYYGLTKSGFGSLLKMQGGVCAICFGAGKAGQRLHIDHCHETNEVRGLLCGNCNQGLGRFKDDPTSLGRAVEYVQR